MGGRDGEDPVLAFERKHLVDKRPHQRKLRRVGPDLPAVVDGHHGLDLTAHRSEHEVEQILRPVDDVGMREFLVEHDDVRVLDALQREMTMRIELDADDATVTDDLAGACDNVALDVVVAIGDHRPVQAQHHRIERHRRLDLAEDLVAHELVVALIHCARRRSREATPFDQGEAIALRPLSGDEERRGAHARRVGRMLSWPEEEALLERAQARREGREGVGFRRDCGREDAHDYPVARGRSREHGSPR